jgi:hypothetical protein
MIAYGERNLARMPDKLGIANSHCQGRLNLPACLLLLAVDMKGPGVSIQRVDIVPPRKFLPGNVKCFQRFMRVVGIIKDQFAIRVVPAIGLQQRLLFKFGESFLRLLISSGKLQRLREIK